MNDHPNKHIREAVDYALVHGWRLRKAGPRAHIWGVLLCRHEARDGCRQQVYSTPRVPQNHAERIRRVVDRCPHRPEDEEE
jgi:hypothetical protein